MLQKFVIIIIIIILAIVFVNLIKVEIKRAEERRQYEQRSEWGNVVNTNTGICPRCGGKTIIKAYESGSMETNCVVCGYRTTSKRPDQHNL